MASRYLFTSITGYKSHFSTQNVVLPLKYPRVLANLMANDIFTACTSIGGGIISMISDELSYIDYVTYDLLHDSKTIVLTPVSLENKLKLRFRNLQISLPHQISNKSCLSVTLYNTADSQSEPEILIDIMDINHLFITMRIELSDFIESQTKRLELNVFNTWGHISVPYSFELRSAPYLIKTVDPLNIVVSLKDGGILHFSRFDVLGDFDVYNFSDATSLLSLNVFGGFFKGNSEDTVIEGVSCNALADMLLLKNGVLVTYSINKMLRFWNMDTHEPANKPINLRGTNPHNSWLTSVPNKYLQTLNYEDSVFLSVLLTNYDDNKSVETERSNGYEFRLFEVPPQKSKELSPLDRLTFMPSIPKEKSQDFASPLWIIQDFQIIKKEDLKAFCLWKSNTSSVLGEYSLDFSNGTITSVTYSQSLGIETLHELSPYREIDFYRNRIFNSGRYDESIVLTALNIFRENSKLSPPIKRKALKNLVIDTIASLTKDGLEEKSYWFKLDSLCEELKKISDGSMALSVISDGFILASQVNGVSIFRKGHEDEFIIDERVSTTSNDDAGLPDILRKFTVLLSSKTYARLMDKVQSLSKIDSDIAEHLFKEFLESKIPSSTIALLLQYLSQIPDAISQIEQLIDGKNLEAEFLRSNVNDLCLFNRLTALITFKDMTERHQFVLLNMLILLLVCEPNSKVLELLNKAVDKLATLSIANYIFDTCTKEFKITGLGRLENSIFWSGVVSKHSSLISYIRAYDYNHAYEYFYGSILSSHDNFVVDLSLELIKLDEGKLVREKFFKFLNEKRTIDRFLIGIVYLINNEPTKFFDTFENFDDFSVNSDEIRTKVLSAFKTDSRVKEFVLATTFDSSVNSSLRKASYYHALSDLCRSQVKFNKKNLHKVSEFVKPDEKNHIIEKEFISRGLKFELEAIESLGTPTSKEAAHLADQYNLAAFEMALSLSNYDIVYRALSSLNQQSADADGISYDFRSLLMRFIGHLIFHHQISELFQPERTFYKRSYLIIDSILLEIANNELSLSNSLRCYELLYSWRLFGASIDLSPSMLGDKRGAVEALYMFITRFKIEMSSLLTTDSTSFDDVKEYKLKVLELYLIILNCLKSMENDEEKWLIKSRGIEGLSAVTLEDINREYFDWLAQLELELQVSST